MSKKEQGVYAYICVEGFANDYDVLYFSSKKNFEEYIDLFGLHSVPKSTYKIITKEEAQKIIKKNKEIAYRPKYEDTLERYEMMGGYFPMYISDGDEELKWIKACKT